MHYILDQLSVIGIVPPYHIKVVSCAENLSSLCQITHRQSMAELEVTFLGFPVSCLSFLICIAPTVMALCGSFRGLSGKSLLLFDLLPILVASHIGCSPILLLDQAYKSIALCYIHHHYSICVQCHPEPNLPSAEVDSFSNLYMLVRKRKLKRESTQDLEIHKSNSETVHSF